ncbi:MAG: anti-sigma factor antagonist (spoIIAA-2)/anti sigma b factor antagonist RsbV [Jatrophihabitans sp.]|nr:anti-sigma factor antagonist (spoIIAA-2)/anti sigma b factor antagonist RsbV [Jatrophihabitans sp.]
MTATAEPQTDPQHGGASMSVETVRFDPTRASIKVVGELDLATAPPLWAVLRGHLAAGRRFARLDVSGVTFLDATTLTGIARAHEDFLASRGTLVITGVRAPVARALRLTGLDETLFVGGPRGDDDDLDATDLSDRPPASR